MLACPAPACTSNNQPPSFYPLCCCAAHTERTALEEELEVLRRALAAKEADASRLQAEMVGGLVVGAA